MDTTKLQAFCTVAGCKSFSEAGRRLNYTQPAISAQIRELENELDVVLFTKSGKRVELSEAGKAVLPFAERLLRNFQDFRGALPGIESKSEHTVRIGASGLPGVHLVPDLMREARLAIPDISFTLGIHARYHVERLLFARQIDVGFVGSKRLRPSTGAVTERVLLRDDLVAVFHPKHPYASRERITLAELATLPLILPPRNILTRRQIEERFNRQGLPLNMYLEIGNAEAIKAMVRHELGVTVLCRSAIASEAEVGWLRPVPVDGLDSPRWFCLLTMRDAKRSAIVADFIELVHNRFDPESINL